METPGTPAAPARPPPAPTPRRSTNGTAQGHRWIEAEGERRESRRTVTGRAHRRRFRTQCHDEPDFHGVGGTDVDPIVTAAHRSSSRAGRPSRLPSPSAVVRLPIDPQLGTSLWTPGLRGWTEHERTGRPARCPPDTPIRPRIRGRPPVTLHSGPARPTCTDAGAPQRPQDLLSLLLFLSRRRTEDQGWGASEGPALHRAGVSDPPVRLYRDDHPRPARRTSDPGGQR